MQTKTEIHVDGFFSIVLLKGHFKERNTSEINTDIRRTLYRCKPINTIAPTDQCGSQY